MMYTPHSDLGLSFTQYFLNCLSFVECVYLMCLLIVFPPSVHFHCGSRGHDYLIAWGVSELFRPLLLLSEKRLLQFWELFYLGDQE